MVNNLFIIEKINWYNIYVHITSLSMTLDMWVAFFFSWVISVFLWNYIISEDGTNINDYLAAVRDMDHKTGEPLNLDPCYIHCSYVCRNKFLVNSSCAKYFVFTNCWLCLRLSLSVSVSVSVSLSLSHIGDVPTKKFILQYAYMILGIKSYESNVYVRVCVCLWLWALVSVCSCEFIILFCTISYTTVLGLQNKLFQLNLMSDCWTCSEQLFTHII